MTSFGPGLNLSSKTTEKGELAPQTNDEVKGGVLRKRGEGSERGEKNRRCLILKRGKPGNQLEFLSTRAPEKNAVQASRGPGKEEDGMELNKKGERGRRPTERKSLSRYLEMGEEKEGDREPGMGGGRRQREEEMNRNIRVNGGKPTSNRFWGMRGRMQKMFLKPHDL